MRNERCFAMRALLILPRVASSFGALALDKMREVLGEVSRFFS